MLTLYCLHATGISGGATTVVLPTPTQLNSIPISTQPASSPPTPPQISDSTPLPSNPTESSGGSDGVIIAAAVIATTLGVLILSVVIVVVIWLVRRRQPSIYEVKDRPDKMDNPVYQGI